MRCISAGPGERIVLFDNERGKGDHVHMRRQEHPHRFTDPERLIEDLKAAVAAATRGDA